MPYRSNPHYSDPTWGRATENLVSGLFGNPAQEAQFESQLTQARLGQQQGRRNEEVWEAFGDTDIINDAPGFVQTVGQFFGPDQVQHTGDLLLAAAGVDDSSTDDQVRRRFIGAGNAPGADFAASGAEADHISARNAEEAFREMLMREQHAGRRQNSVNTTALERERLNQTGQTEREQLRLNNPRDLEAALAKAVLGGDMPLGDAYRIYDPNVERNIAGSDLSLDDQARLVNNRGFTGDEFGPNRGGTFTGESGSGGGRGEPSIGDRISFGDAIDGVVGVAVPGFNPEDRSTDLPPQDRLDLESRAAEIWRESGQTISPAEAVNQALAEFGGIEFADPGRDGWFSSSEPSNPRLVRPGGNQGQQQQPVQPPPMHERRVGQIYDTPRGPMMWAGEGWIQPEA